MSKKIVEDSELQTLTLSPTNTDVDETSPFMHHTNETAFPPHTPPAFAAQVPASGEVRYDARLLDATVSAPDHSSKSVPSLRMTHGTTTPSGPGYSTRVTYTNEKKIDLSKISRERPNPANSLVQKKDAWHLDSTSSTARPNLHLPIPNQNSSVDIENISNASTYKNNNLYNGEGTKRKKSDMCEFIVGAPGSHGSVVSPPRDGYHKPRAMERPVQHHSFLTDVSEVRQMEQGLLQLMDDFQQGNLRAFGKDSRLRQMEAIREQQERLARLHFDVGAEQDLYPPLSEEGLRTSQKNMTTLMEKLAQLSESIERLHTNAATDRKVPDRKCHGQPQQTPGHHGHHHHHHNHQSPNTAAASSQSHLPANMANNNNVQIRTHHNVNRKNGLQHES